MLKLGIKTCSMAKECVAPKRAQGLTINYLGSSPVADPWF